ncbi:MAG: hypothetical protein GY751_08375, partial [Bacteroidetes bacterium]|nr:hypothetical protein [Bacteroidota bacterium]
DVALSDNFGYSVEISGDRLVASAIQDDDNGLNSGSAYIFKFDGSNFIQEQKITASDGAAGDRYGLEVSISDGVAVVGSDLDDSPLNNSGSAYVYRFNGITWVQEQKLTASDQGASDQYGLSVSVSNDRIFIGNGYDDAPLSNSGSVYLYTYNGSTWTDEQKITASDAFNSDYFGMRGSISGDWAVAGAYSDDDNFGNSGSAYFFKATPGDIYTPQVIDACDSTQVNGAWYSETQIVNDTLSVGTCQDSIVTTDLTIIEECTAEEYCEIQKVLASDATTQDDFGYDVAISGNFAIVSALREDHNAAGGSYQSQAGSAYIFEKVGENWLQVQKIVASDRSSTDWFGSSVAISGNYAVVGAYQEDHDVSGSNLLSNAGSAYVFKNISGVWTEIQKIVASDRFTGDYFGFTVAISGGNIVIGAPYEDEDENGDNFQTGAGSAYIFENQNDTWVQVQKIVSADRLGNDRFGTSVAIAGDRILVGAETESQDENGNNTMSQAGSAYIFKYGNGTWVQEQKIVASDRQSVDRFGKSVDISDNVLIVGAYEEDQIDDGSGAAYIFSYNGSSWVEDDKVIASDGGYRHYFGYDVSISGSTAFIGSWWDDEIATRNGAGFVFTYNGTNWVESQKILSSDAGGEDVFGTCVDISGNNIIAGARGNSDNGANSGSAYFFEPSPGDIYTPQAIDACDSTMVNGVWYSETQIVYDSVNLSTCQDSIIISDINIADCSIDEYCEKLKVTASDAAAGDVFGSDVSVSGNWAIIGASRNDDNGTDGGSVYIYQFDGNLWSQFIKLVPLDNGGLDRFGSSVSISGNFAAIGAHGDEDNGPTSGAVYVYWFNGTTWVEQQKLVTDDINSGSLGYSVSISGNTIAAGAFGDDVGGTNSGSVYVFQYDGNSWMQTKKLNASDAAANDNFGIDVSIAGDQMIAGAYNNDFAGSNSGSAYIFKYDGADWNENIKLTASDAAAGDQFGARVSIADGVAIVGAINNDSPSNSGSAYIFRYSGGTWSQEQKLVASNATASARFGNDVSISGDYAIIGAYSESTGGSSSGAAYMFKFNGSVWAESQKYKASDIGANDNFGLRAAISGNSILISSPDNDDAGSSSGSAYFFEPTPGDIYTPQAIDACDSTQINSIWYSETQIVSDTFTVSTCQDSVVITDLTVADCEVDGYCEFQKVLASDGVADDDLGYSIAVSGNWAIVGAPGVNSDEGGAYMYFYNGTLWTQTQELNPIDGVAGDRAGLSVSISGNWAIIGADQEDNSNGTNAGSAYVYYYDGSSWIPIEKLTASDGAASQRFGTSVSISGNMVVVGAGFGSGNVLLTGAAYFYQYNGSSWTEIDKVYAADGVANDHFGNSVSIAGNQAVVGIYGDDDVVSNSGSAIIYTFNGTSWTETTKLTASDPGNLDWFGYSVSITEDQAIIGALNDDDVFSGSGSAYIFTYNGVSWSQTSKLTASDAGNTDMFGQNVSISGNTAVVGAYANDDNGGNSGSAYMFKYNGSSWDEINKVTSSDAAGGDQFGWSTAISGNVIAIGAVRNDDNGSNSGSAYFFFSVDKIYTPQVIDNCDSAQVNGTWYSETQIVSDTFSIGTCQDSIVTTDLTISECAIEDYCEFQKLSASDGAFADNLGFDVDIFGNWVIAAAQKADGNASNSGGAYVFQFNGTTWVEDQEITTSDGNSDEFLSQVAISDDVLALGSALDDDLGTNIGSGYIFRYNGTNWVEEQKLTPSDGQSQDMFGHSADISGNIAVFGAIGDDDNGSQSGSAYVFHFDGSTWVEFQKLTASNAAFNDRFGWDVSIAGDKIVVGADEGSSSNGNGRAYVFAFNGTTWVEEQALLAPDGALNDFFGSSVSITEDWLIVGARADDDVASATGSAYVYQYNGSNWAFDQKLTASDAQATDVYGTSVSMSGNKIIVGAYADDDNGSTSGSFYLYYYDGVNWNEHQKFIASDGEANDRFGYDVSISGDRIVSGAYNDDDADSEAGAVYFFEPKLPPFEVNISQTSCDSAVINGNTYFSSQTVIDTLSASSCQDSIVTTNLTIEDGSVTIICPSDTTVIESGSGCSAAITLPSLDVTLGECLQNTGLNFDGINDKISIGSIAGFVTGNATRTFETWIRRANGGVITNLFTYGSSGSTTKWFVQVNASGQLNLQAGTINKSWNSNLDDGNWHHVAVVHNGGSLTNTVAYVDGLLATPLNNPTSTPTTGNSTTISIGASAFSPFYYFGGDMDEVRYWDDARTPAEILANYNIELVGNEANLIAYYNFEQGDPCGVNTTQFALLDVASVPIANNGTLLSFNNLAGNGPTPCISNYTDGFGSNSSGLFNDYNGTSDASDTYPEGTTTVTWTYVTIYGDSFQCTQDVTVECLTGTPNAVDACDSALINGTWYYETQVVYDTLAPNDSIVITDLTIADCDLSSYCELNRVLATDGNSGDLFGGNVAISGEWAVVGAFSDNGIGSNSGSAYVYNFNGATWVFDQKLIASDETANDEFGWNVAVSGEVIVIGAHRGNSNTGAAYFFRYNGTIWIEEQKVIASDPGSGEFFGGSVDVSGAKTVIGAPLDNSGQGAAYVFSYDGTTWIEVTKLTASDGVGGDNFGSSVAISGENILVSAHNDDDNGGNSGSAYVFLFDGSTWNQDQKLTASDGVSSDQFGYNVSLSGDRAILGALNDDDNGSNSGSAYIFDHNGSNWVQTQKISASDGDADDIFGQSVAISGDLAMVGTYLDEENGANSGAAYVYRFNGAWSEVEKLAASDAMANNRFGNAVALSGNYGVIGSFGNSGNRGAAYFFEPSPGNVSFPIGINACDSTQVLGTWITETQLITDTINISTCVDSIVFYDVTIADCDVDQYCELEKILASDGASSDNFGNNVHVDGNSAIVAAYDANACYIFRYDGSNWVEEQIITTTGLSSADNFGIGLGIQGNWAVVGNNGDDDIASNAGAVHIFYYDGSSWSEVQKLFASDAAAADLFGTSAAISAGKILVGARDAGTGTSGAAYIFEYSGSSWVQSQKLLPFGGTADRFGGNVDLWGDVAVVGAYGSDAAFTYRFDGNNWVDETKLEPSDGGGSFSTPVAVSGDWVVVGDVGKYSNEGAVYAFKYNGSSWIEEQILTASDGIANDLFGRDLDISGNTLVVGSWRDDGDFTESGSAFVFKYNGSSWIEKQKIYASDEAGSDRFGLSAGISGNHVVIGASQNDGLASDAGAVYFFQPSDTNIVVTQDIEACDSAFSAGQWYYSSTTLADTIVDVGANCADSIYITDITINSSYAVYDTIVNCDSALVNGSYYDSSQTVIDTFLSATLCDSIITTTLDILKNIYYPLVIDACDSAQINGSWYFETQVVYDTFNLAGCQDSIVVSDLSISDCGINDYCEIQNVLASDGIAGDQFGWDVDASGNFAIVGVTALDLSSRGGAYIYEFNGTTWTEVQKLSTSDGIDGGDGFGMAVSISGNVAIVGAFDDASVYIYRYNGTTWVEEQKIRGSTLTLADYFGWSVYVSGNHLIAGAIYDDDNGGNSGSAFIYYYDGNSWVEQAKLLASDGTSVDFFGRKVAISGDIAMVSADNANVFGSVYVYELVGGSWLEQQIITPADGISQGYFGASLDISENWAVIGARHDDDNGSFSGAAYVYEYNGTNYSLDQKLIASDGSAGRKFGSGLDIERETIVIRDRTTSPYLFRYDGSNWNEIQILNASVLSASSENYGHGIALSSNHILLGAPKGNQSGALSGAVFFFEPSDTISLYDSTAVAACDSSFLRGQWYYSSQTISDTIYDAGANCVDSIYIIDLTINSSYTIYDTVVACDSALVNVTYYYITQVVYDTFSTVNSCDSVVITDLEILNNIYSPMAIDACDSSFVNGAWYFETQIIYDTFALVGCNDSIVITDLNIEDCTIDEYCQFQKILASDGGANDNFANDVSISGNVAIIGALNDDDNGTDKGAAYIFRYNGTSWIEEQKLTASDGPPEPKFGYSVAISGDYAIVGATDPSTSAIGAAYIYHYNGSSWIQIQKLLPSDAMINYKFGIGVDISGTQAIVGARLQTNGGAAYIFEFDGTTWNEVQKLVSSDNASSDFAGQAVSIADNVAILGAYGEDDNGSFGGAAYMFRFNGIIWI